MSTGFLLTRTLLKFDDLTEDLIGDLSAVTITPDGYLWLGSDELLGIERLSPVKPGVFGEHQHFSLQKLLDLPEADNEIDIEGLDYAAGYLWVVGSHSTKRKKPRQKDPDKDIDRLTTIETEFNRYLLARIPVIDGQLVRSYDCSPPNSQSFSAARLEITDQQNALMVALAQDPHIGSFVSRQIPSKDNGLDIEGIAIKNNRIFLGLRGPVIRGIAIILELEVTTNSAGFLELKPLDESGTRYYKHLLDLDGLGVRDICFDQEDLLILSGPAMDADGFQKLFRFKDLLKQQKDTITFQDSDELELVFELPLTVQADKAEGLVMFPCLDQSESVMIVYDSPSSHRHLTPKTVLTDVFSLKISV